MRTIHCHCGATVESPGGFLGEEKRATGFCPVVTFGGGIAWFCPACAGRVRAAVKALREACGADADALIVPMLRKMGEE